MKTYIVSGHGRAVGAIGIFHSFTCLVKAESVEDAKVRVYDQYEHISGMRVSEKQEVGHVPGT